MPAYVPSSSRGDRCVTRRSSPRRQLPAYRCTSPGQGISLTDEQDFREADLSDRSFRGVVYEEADFTGADLSSAVFEDCAFLNCRFERTRLAFVRLAGCKLTGSTFLRCELRPLTVDGGDWSYVTLRQADLRGVSFAEVRLAEADLSDADLSACSLAGADLSHARMRGVKLRGADLRGAVLDGCEVDLVDWTDVRIDVALAVLLAKARGAIVGP